MYESLSSSRSIAPIASENEKTSSSETELLSNSTIPHFSKRYATEFCPPIFPPSLSNAFFTSAYVLFELSVVAETSKDILPGPNPSYNISFICEPSPPSAFLIARCIVSLGILTDFARSIASLSLKFFSGSDLFPAL